MPANSRHVPPDTIRECSSARSAGKLWSIANTYLFRVLTTTGPSDFFSDFAPSLALRMCERPRRPAFQSIPLRTDDS